MANTKQKTIIKLLPPKEREGEEHKRGRKKKVWGLVEQLTKFLMVSGKVKVAGLGIFEIRSVKERKGYGIGTDGSKPIIIPAHKKIAFRPTKKIKELIQTYGD